jgi:hypothetical protein
VFNEEIEGFDVSALAARQAKVLGEAGLSAVVPA